MSFAHGDTACSLENRRVFCGEHSITSDDLVCCRQAHTDRIVQVRAADRGRGAYSHEGAFSDTDALVTDVQRLPLAVFAADCLTAALFDPRAPAVAAVHAGWRGTQQRILAKTVVFMQQAFGADPAQLHAWFNPCIRACCYRVGEEFAGFFPLHTRRAPDGLYFDMAGENRQQLIEAGVLPERIGDEGLCTCCREKDFFSFRRQGSGCGRMMAVVMLR
jgi:hypothetical protein